MLVPDLPGLEQAVAERWAKSRLASRFVASAADDPDWLLLSEPMAATGVPSLSFLRARAITDVYGRLRSMQGYRVRHRHGWSCHGLGVEIAVARELGLASPAEVLAYGVAPFVARCRESALRHVASQTGIAVRLGCLDLTGTPESGQPEPSAPYQTMDPRSIEAIWARLRQLFDAGLLVRDYRVGRSCPRCRTQLAEHELRQAGVYAPVPGLTVVAKLRLEQLLPATPAELLGTELLVSTHSPWILAASEGVAIDPARTYALARRAGHGERVILTEDRFASVLGAGWHIAARFSGSELDGARYRPVWSLDQESLHAVWADPALAAGSGTGIAPFAPSHGAGGRLAEPDPPESASPALIGQDGRFDARLPGIGGLPFAEAGPAIAEYLADRDALFAARASVRRRPHCWRCGTLLLSTAKRAWFLRVSAWRSGEWMVSRTGYWGSPLPIWECELQHATCVSSLAELSALAGRDLAGLDPHRPELDQVEIRCRDCGQRARRVPEIVDPALDAAVLALDGEHSDTAGQLLTVAGARMTSWRYALTSLGTVTESSPTRLAATGWSAGQEAGVPSARRRPPPPIELPPLVELPPLIEPWPLIEQYGADALRWHFAAWSSHREPEPGRALPEVVRTVLLPYWNCAMLYASRAGLANTGGQDRAARGTSPPPPRLRPALDRWLLSELQSVVAEVTAAFESGRSDLATRRLQRFLTSLSRWYARQWKRRLDPERQDADVVAGLATFRECLVTVTCLMAPVVPFIADYVWGLVRDSAAPESVHRAPWPCPAVQLLDAGLQAEMSLVRQVVRAGRAARTTARIAAWQPLATARVAAEGFANMPADLRALVADELNVRDVEPASPEALAALPGWVTVRRPACTVSLDPAIDDELRLAGLVRSARRAIQRARRAAGLGADDVISLAWRTSDPQLAVVLGTARSDLGRSVRAAEFGEVPRGTPTPPHMIEHRNPALRLHLWLAPDAPATVPPGLTSADRTTAAGPCLLLLQRPKQGRFPATNAEESPERRGATSSCHGLARSARQINRI